MFSLSSVQPLYPSLSAIKTDMSWLGLFQAVDVNDELEKIEKGYEDHLRSIREKDQSVPPIGKDCPGATLFLPGLNETIFFKVARTKRKMTRKKRSLITPVMSLLVLVVECRLLPQNNQNFN
jgi:hypothetical protein